VAAEALLYQPILHAIDAREERIAANWRTPMRKAEAQQERDAFQRKNAEFDSSAPPCCARHRLRRMRARARLAGAARTAECLGLARRLESLTERRPEQPPRHPRRTQQEVFAIARKVLADLAAHESGGKRMCESSRAPARPDGPGAAALGRPWGGHGARAGAQRLCLPADATRRDRASGA
jgi:hypothetical protein